MTSPAREDGKTCITCSERKDREDFILGVKRGSDGHMRTSYGRECDDCRFTRDWGAGLDTPAVEGLVPYERAKLEVAYHYRRLPKTWINRSGMLSQLHGLLMCKYGKVRDEDVDARIAELKADIEEFGVDA